MFLSANSWIPKCKETPPAYAPGGTHPRRTLMLWDLICYGILLIEPLRRVQPHGVAQTRSDGHFVTILLIVLITNTDPEQVLAPSF